MQNTCLIRTLYILVLMLVNHSLKIKHRQFDNVVVTGGTVICHNDNLWCHQWRQSFRCCHFLLSLVNAWNHFHACVRLLNVYISVQLYIPWNRMSSLWQSLHHLLHRNFQWDCWWHYRQNDNISILFLWHIKTTQTVYKLKPTVSLYAPHDCNIQCNEHSSDGVNKHPCVGAQYADN